MSDRSAKLRYDTPIGTKATMVASVVHLDAGSLEASQFAELCSGAALLAGRLQQQGIPAVTLLQCSGASDAASCVAAMQAAPLPQTTPPPLIVSQPGQLPVSLRLALEHLATAAPGDIVFVSVANSSNTATQALKLGCGAVEQLPASAATAAQVQAWGLQAVACHAALGKVPPVLMVGYVMKQSRQLDLCRQGMLPLLAGPSPADAGGLAAAVGPAAATSPGDGGVSFFPIDIGSNLPHQLQRCYLVLQKLTDFLRASSSGSGAVAPFSPEAVGLLAALEQQQGQQQHQQQQEQQQHNEAVKAAAAVQVHMVDPAASLQPVMDRALLAQHLQATALTMRRQGIPMRAPASLLLHQCNAADTPRLLAAAGVSMPCILKPQAACGVAEAHQMAFVLHGSGLDGLEVPLPAVAQEYVDHGGQLWKVYAAGQRVFWTQRTSTPDLGRLAAQLAADPDADIPASIGFDSLRSLPTKLPELQRGARVQAGSHDDAEGAAGGSTGSTGAGGGAGEAPGQQLMQQATFEAVAAALRQRLGLTLFGFDLVLDHSAGELVIVDVNYFPSFKGIPEAPSALQAALRERRAALVGAGAAGA